MDSSKRIVARNRRALHEYEILDQWEAGLVLAGPEVKSIREGRVNLQDAFARIEGEEAWLYNMHVSPYEPANRWNLEPTRRRKLLLKRSELRRLVGGVAEKGLTLVPLDLYFRRGYARVSLALARGKKLHDKRETLKRKAMDREIERAIKDRT
ncbi:MAG: SsrA-binding protein SmpB [Longimicrobiales bacterium]